MWHREQTASRKRHLDRLWILMPRSHLGLILIAYLSINRLGIIISILKWKCMGTGSDCNRVPYNLTWTSFSIIQVLKRRAPGSLRWHASKRIHRVHAGFPASKSIRGTKQMNYSYSPLKWRLTPPERHVMPATVVINGKQPINMVGTSFRQKLIPFKNLSWRKK